MEPQVEWCWMLQEQLGITGELGAPSEYGVPVATKEEAIAQANDEIDEGFEFTVDTIEMIDPIPSLVGTFDIFDLGESHFSPAHDDAGLCDDDTLYLEGDGVQAIRELQDLVEVWARKWVKSSGTFKLTGKNEEKHISTGGRFKR